MARVLIVKTSSMGDVIHAFPALADLRAQRSEVHVDWVVESAFAGIARLHPGIDNVIVSDLRKWKRAPFSAPARAAVRAFKHTLRAQSYDAIIDLQGLLKSAWISRQARGLRHGYDRQSIREPLASLFYEKKFAVSKSLHAVERNRALLAAACGYELPATRDYGLQGSAQKQRLIVCCHATSRDDKLWPESHWRELIAQSGARGFAVGLPWGSASEEARANRLADGFAHARVWPRDPFHVLAQDLANAACVVGVDTGLLHLSCAVNTPTLGIYVSTSPQLSGAWGGQAPAENVGEIGQLPSVDAVAQRVWALAT